MSQCIPAGYILRYILKTIHLQYILSYSYLVIGFIKHIRIRLNVILKHKTMSNTKAMSNRQNTLLLLIQRFRLLTARCHVL